MVAFKSLQVPGFLADPPRRFSAVLLYGPEAGLVADRAEQLARTAAVREGPDAEIVRLDEASLAADPASLAVETRTRPMFGGRRIVRLKAGARAEALDLADLLESGLDAVLVVEAGNLRPTSKLRQAFERAASAAALPCYMDADRDLPPLVDAELARAGLSATGEVRAHLVAQMAADPGLARQELAKLALYLGSTRTVTLEDVESVVGDSSQAALDSLANAAAAGDAGSALRQFDRLLAAGTDAQAVLIVMARHFDQLHRLTAQAEAGTPVEDAVGRLRPPLHFRQRDALARQVRGWSRRAAAHVVAMLQETTRDSRLRPDLDRALVERAIWTVAGRMA